MCATEVATPSLSGRRDPLHRCRKILKVGGAEYPIAREARAKILRPRPLHVKPRPFLHDRCCYHEFLGEKINCKSSRIDLVAIEAYLLIIRPGKCLKIFIICNNTGLENNGALPPFLKYWGGYSPLSPPGSYAYALVFALRYLILKFYQGTGQFGLGLYPGRPWCSYATE